jgi:DNA polymerase-3 subunit delta'
MVERTGASVDIDEARRLVGLAQRRPLEADRQVLVVADVHLAERSAPALLKTVEEPPPSTVFILLAESLPPELVTLVSRSVVVPFPPLPPEVLAAWLAEQGVDRRVAAMVAESSGGDPDRARLLAEDPAFVERYELWHSVPARLDGTGAVAAELAQALAAANESALGPLRARHAVEVAALEAEAAANGERGVPGRREVLDRQRREERRWRTDELRAGLGVLSRSYRDRMVEALGRPGRAGAAEVRGCEAAVDLITAAAGSLERNPNESMLLQGLMVRLADASV